MGPLLTGSLIWLVIAAVSAFYILKAVREQSPALKVDANLK
jgi:hypothetical protein